MATVLGILSDSHGDVERTRRAIAQLQAEGATMFVHCGDVECEPVVDLFAGLDAHLTWGNCDPAAPMSRYARHIGVESQHPLGSITVDDQRILFLHGDDEALLAKALAMGAPYLLHGHTHLKSDVMHGTTRVINPGAFCRTHGNPRTVARLVPATGELRFLTVT